MKYLTFFTLLLLFSFSGNAQEVLLAEAATEKEVIIEDDGAYIKWESLVHDFGEIPKDKPVVAFFELTNTSDSPFVLTKVSGSCGCTATDYPEDPILPGETKKIKATFDAKEPGTFVKSVTVFTSRESRPYILMLRGFVVQSF